MKKIRVTLAASALLVLSCNFLGNVLNPSPTPTDSDTVSYTDCPDAQPTQEDINRALEYSNSYFNSPDWSRSYTVSDYRVSVTWVSEELGALAYFDDVTFCAVTNGALDDYYTDATLDIIFQNYDEYEAQKDCRSNDLRLTEFKVKDEGTDYFYRFWVEILDKDHIRQSSLVFPTKNMDLLDSYSKKIMPTLSSCE